ncbi:phospholipid-transporting ATPase 6-like [Rutidosis leptorrhynchoides]|uniref:phospholipid-transporting ATPase 6-like n=1 Tax=Rutidosis leptorrhynchoides TaxID=125765 RepID=UPI003A99B74C
MGKRGIGAKLLRSSLYTLANIRTKPSYKKEEATGELSGYPRVIHVNQPTVVPEDTSAPIFCSNYVSTTKYTFYNFLPIALFEQFNRVANFYFLVAAGLTFTDYAPFEWPSQVVPLALVVGFSLAKEMYEDLQRNWQDKAANCRKSTVHIGNGVFDSKQWREVCVGDIVKVKKDEFFPADLLLLQSSYEDGMSYVETMNLDGETNLKVKRALQNLSFPIVDDDKSSHFKDFKATIRCENPNSNLYTFTGNLEYDGHIHPLEPAQLLLRDSKLRNTEFVFGVAVFTGNDTKVMQNTTQSPSKRSKIELQMDKIIYLLFGLLIFISIVSASGFGLFVRNMVPFWWYLMPDVPGEDFDINNFLISGLRHLVTALMLYGYLVPISLYVSIEAVKILQARFINNDLHLYDEVTGVPANARTSNLNEQLGQVDTILSDKTGTLTCNQMDFLKCSIAGCPYGKRLSEVELAAAKQIAAQLESNDAESSSDDAASLEAITINDDGNVNKKETIKGFSFQDDRLQNGNWLKEPNADVILLFFRILAVCHTAIPEVNEKTGELTYEAESPDEGAFLVAAREFGFHFIKRTQNSVVVRERLSKDQEPVEKEYNILTLLDFTSKRKRMSVIVRDETGQILMFCKGADTIIFDRLASNGKMYLESTTKHLNDYGDAGMRTLALAYKKLEESEYSNWAEKFHKAQIASGPNREELLEELSDSMERELTLVGSTAVEDKLQKGVPECIDRLALAGLKIWVLTGDKMETAINIGFSCSLLRQGMKQICIVVDAEMLAESGKNVIKENILTQITNAAQMIQNKKDTRNSPFALIIEGKTLTYALEDDLKFQFLNLAVNCASVICCRVSPKQKALVVRLVKEGTGRTTLGIGDGANDVGMIKEADIGIGISGVEGMQAVMASDFSIAQFRFLERLLIVHGHWCYKRISKMICYFFYKNITLALTLFYFEAETGFSGQMHYDDWYMLLYNVFLTSCPVLALGVLEKDICAEFCLQFPALYQQGPKNLFFDWYRIIGWLANGVYASFVIYLVNLKIFSPESFRKEGQTADMYVIGTAMFTSIIWVVNVQIFLISHYLTRVQLHTIWGSIVVWYLIVYIYGMMPVKWSSGNIYHQLTEVLGPAHKFYLSTVFVTLLCNLPYLIHISYQRCYNPEDHHVLQEMKNLRKDVTDRKMWKSEQDKARQETEIGLSARVDAKMRNMKGRMTRKYSSLAVRSS